MSADPQIVTRLPTAFQVAFAATVKSTSTNRTFNVRSLADLINAEQPVPQDTIESMAKNYDSKKALNNAIKCLRPAIYPAVFPDGARVRNMANIEGVTMITFDMDGRGGDTIPRAKMVERCAELKLECVLWDTFSSEDDGLTYRIQFPMAKVLASDCYAAASQAVKDYIGFGPLTFLPSSQAYFISPRVGRRTNPVALFGHPIDTVLDFTQLEAAADAAMPAGASSTFDPLEHVWNLEKQALAARCLRLIEPWSGDRNHWIGIIAAMLRGWGFTPQILSDPSLQNESHRGLLTMLDEWSKNEHPPAGCQPKYSKDCVVSEGKKLLREATKRLGIQGLVRKAHEHSPEGIGEALVDDEVLHKLAMQIMGERSKPAQESNLPSFEELVSATSERHAKVQKNRMLADRQAMVIHDMPACFGRVRDWCVEFASKGELTKHSELTDDYRFAIDPISAVLSVAQMMSVIIGGRVWVNQGLVYPPTQLNTYFLRIAGSGTGKSTSMAWLKGIMDNTVFEHSIVGNMSFSSGGFWPNTFDRLGYNVFQLTDEGETIIAGHVGNSGANLKSLHTLLLTAYSAGHEKGTLYPPLYSTGGKAGAKQNNNFEAVLEPNLNLQVIGTHTLIPQISTAEFMQNGFSARFIIRIEPKQAEESADDVLNRQLLSCIDGDAPIEATESPMLEAQARFAKHLATLDVELHNAGRGCALHNLVGSVQFDMGLEDSKLTPSIYKEANKQRQLEARTGHHIHKDRACGMVMAEAELFFIPYVHDNGLLEAVKHREVEKLTKLAAIYTLGCNPGAKVIDHEKARYLMNILQMAQMDFLTLERTSSGIPARWADRMKMLEREVSPGGVLFEAGPDGAPSNKLIQSNRAWRDLIKDIRLGDDDLKGVRAQAKQVMSDLGVAEKPVGKGINYFLTR